MKWLSILCMMNSFVVLAIAVGLADISTKNEKLRAEVSELAARIAVPPPTPPTPPTPPPTPALPSVDSVRQAEPLCITAARMRGEVFRLRARGTVDDAAKAEELESLAAEICRDKRRL